MGAQIGTSVKNVALENVGTLNIAIFLETKPKTKIHEFNPWALAGSPWALVCPPWALVGPP